MTEVIVAILTIAGTWLTGRAWSTLDRRVKDHTALLKDMPAPASAPLQELLTLEVAELVRRDQRRLNGKVDWLINVRRVVVILAGLLIVVSGWGAITSTVNVFTPGQVLWGGILSAACFTIAITLTLARVTTTRIRQERRRRSG